MTAQALAQPMLINNSGFGGHISVKELFFAPIRFCGRQWMWIRDDQTQISQMVLKILALPFWACATLVAGSVALVGALAFSPDHIPGCFDSSLCRNPFLVRRDISNEVVARQIKAELKEAGCECSVEVQSLDSDIFNGEYRENIHRYVTLVNASSTTTSRVGEVIKYHFWNKQVVGLDGLYPCLCGIANRQIIGRLNDLLALYGAVTFSMAFDLAYIRTELGYPLSH